MLTTTEGIILKSQKYAEADLIVTCLTLKKGIIKIFAKSPRKTKSRFGSSLEPFTYAKIGLFGKEQSMQKIVQSDIIKPFHRLREDFNDFINISKLAEILISLTPENFPNRKLFLYFLETMGLLESSSRRQKDILYLTSQIHLLTLLGYAPRLNGCGKCGAESLDFYPDSGTTLCRKCVASRAEIKKPPIKITNKLVKFYSHCINWPVHTSRKLRPPQEAMSSLAVLLEEHISHLLNKKLLSSEFLLKV